MSPWRLTIGLVLAALGGLLLGERLGYANAHAVISQWWPLAIVLLGITHWIANPGAPRGAAVVVLVGAALLVGELGLVPGGASGLLWPVVLIFVGGWILLGRGGRHTSNTMGINRFVAFGGLDVADQSAEFRGGSLNALFGGIKLDLREAQLAPEGAGIEAVAAFGGVEILVPSGWRVNVSGLPLFGGIDNRTLQNGQLPADAPTLDVRATALFGGVEVKH